MQLLAILLWGALGVGLRYFVIQLWPGLAFPWAVLGVNTAGSFLAGYVYANPAIYSSFPHVTPQVLLVGFLGALTTFSAVSLDTVRLLADSQITLAVLNLLLNNAFGLGACYLGLRFATGV